MPRSQSHPLRFALLCLTALIFIAAGLNHFRSPAFYQSIIPPSFPNPPMLVAVSGIAEIAGGIGLLINSLRRAAGWGLIALLIAVFPANVYMEQHPEHAVGLHPAHWLLVLRLPLQGLLIAWVWFISRPPLQQASRPRHT